MLRLIAAFLIAPLVGLLGGALFTWLVFSFGDYRSLVYAGLMVIAGGFFSYPFVLLVGIPFFLLLRRFRMGSLSVFLAIGVLFGIIGWLVASSPVSGPQFCWRAVSEAVFGIVAGILGSATFWRIAVRFNPSFNRTFADPT